MIAVAILKIFFPNFYQVYFVNFLDQSSLIGGVRYVEQPQIDVRNFKRSKVTISVAILKILFPNFYQIYFVKSLDHSSLIGVSVMENTPNRRSKFYQTF